MSSTWFALQVKLTGLPIADVPFCFAFTAIFKVIAEKYILCNISQGIRPLWGYSCAIGQKYKQRLIRVDISSASQLKLTFQFDRPTILVVTPCWNQARSTFPILSLVFGLNQVLDDGEAEDKQDDVPHSATVWLVAGRSVWQWRNKSMSQITRGRYHQKFQFHRKHQTKTRTKTIFHILPHLQCPLPVVLEEQVSLPFKRHFEDNRWLIRAFFY